MKKIILLSAIILMLATPVSAETQVDTETKAKDEFSFVAGSPEYTYNGETMLFDQNTDLAPYISEVTSQFMIPLRAFAENWGFDVFWESTEPETITIARGCYFVDGKVEYVSEEQQLSEYQQSHKLSGYVKLYIGDNANERFEEWISYKGYKTDEPFNIHGLDMGLPPVAVYSEIRGGNTYIPVREWASIIGMEVRWIQEESKVKITDLTAEELFERKIEVSVENKVVSVTIGTKNNSEIYVYRVSPSRDYVGICNLVGEELWVGSRAGTTVVRKSLIPPNNESIKKSVTIELPEGEYYYEWEPTSSWRVNYFKRLNSEAMRCYFEVK